MGAEIKPAAEGTPAGLQETQAVAKHCDEMDLTREVCELPRQNCMRSNCMPSRLCGPACKPIGSMLGMHSPATEWAEVGDTSNFTHRCWSPWPSAHSAPSVLTV